MTPGCRAWVTGRAETLGLRRVPRTGNPNSISGILVYHPRPCQLAFLTQRSREGRTPSAALGEPVVASLLHVQFSPDDASCVFGGAPYVSCTLAYTLVEDFAPHTLVEPAQSGARLALVSSACSAQGEHSERDMHSEVLEAEGEEEIDRACMRTP